MTQVLSQESLKVIEKHLKENTDKTLGKMPGNILRINGSFLHNLQEAVIERLTVGSKDKKEELASINTYLAIVERKVLPVLNDLLITKKTQLERSFEIENLVEELYNLK